MSVEYIFPNSADVREISAQLAHIGAIEAARAAQEGASLPSVYWAEIREIAESGLAKTHFTVGDQFVDKYTDPDGSAHTIYQNPWDVMDFREVEKHDGTKVPGIIIGTHYTQLVAMQFSGWQAFIYSETGLPAGTYNFTAPSAWGSKGLVAGTYQFTLTQPLPAGGQIVGVKRWPDVDISTWTVATYASATSTTAIETVAVTAGSEGTALGAAQMVVPGDTTTVAIDGTDYTYRLNGIHQAAYGYNRWKYSAVRQYLNSDLPAGEWWKPQHVFDRAPDVAATKAGWLAGVPDEFKNALTPIKVLTAPPNAIATAEGITFDVTYDKVFLPSLQEHYINNQGAGEGEAWEYWKEIRGVDTPFPTGVATDELKVYQISNHANAPYRWMRSANRGYGYNVWNVIPSGYVSYNVAASYSFTLAPACAIC